MYFVLSAWVIVFAAALAVTWTKIAVEGVEAWIVGIGAVTFLPVVVVFYAGRSVRARRPFVIATPQGLTPRSLELVRWSAIQRVHVWGPPLQRDLYIELRDPLRTTKGTDRFLLLHEGTEFSKFAVTTSDGDERTITGADLGQELEDLHLAYAGEAAPRSAASPAPATEEIVIPPTVSDRWATGIIGVLAATGAVVLAAVSAWMVLAARRDAFTAPEALVAMLVVAVVAIAAFRGGVRRLAESLAGTPRLIVDVRGLTHVKLGFIPWSEITRIQVDELGGDAEAPVLCAYVTESYYRRRLKGRRFERLKLALRNTSWKLQRIPRLPLIWGFSEYSRKGYLRNGLAMPPVPVEELARLIRTFPR